MARPVLLPLLVAVGATVALVRLALPAFVGTAATPPRLPAPRAMGAVALQARGGARGGAPDIEAWYQETIKGSGGLPEGAIKEYIMKWFWPAADPFTGPGGQPGKKDHKKVFAILQDCVAKGPAFERGSSSAGFGSILGDTNGIDGSPYTWLVGSMTPGGMFLQVTREFPGAKGVRALAVAKIGQEEELWSKIDWGLVNKRLDIEVGTDLEKVEGVKQR
mmetsp:Transcript_23100/g.64108  ORF Transcript_23100/g.64108 Transcript_23100/m.64108 type:complete len:219 (-) Transcript_23100:147-803(-)